MPDPIRKATVGRLRDIDFVELAFARCRRIPMFVVAMTLALAACGGGTDSTSAPPGAEAGGPSGDGPCSTLKESTLEGLFDVTVTPASDDMNGPTFCHFSIDGTAGNGLDVTALNQSMETYDEAVDKMKTTPGVSEGTGLQKLDVGHEAAGFASSGIAFVVVNVGDQIVQVSANLPDDHPLASDDDALLKKTAELAAEAT